MLQTIGRGMSVQSTVNSNVSTSPPPFSPSDISGLQLWFDAADASTITEDINGVSQWDDKSGNNYHVSQSDNALKPTYASGDHLLFSGSGTILTRTQALGLTSISIFVVSEKVTNVGFSNVIVSQGNAGNNWAVFASETSGGNKPSFRTYTNGNSYNSGASNTVTSTNTQYVFTAFYEEISGDKRLYIDGNQVANTTRTGPLDTDESLLQVGNKTGGNADHKIREIIVYDGAISEADTNSIGNYLQDKWGGNFDGSYNGVFF